MGFKNTETSRKWATCLLVTAVLLMPGACNHSPKASVGNAAPAASGPRSQTFALIPVRNYVSTGLSGADGVNPGIDYAKAMVNGDYFALVECRSAANIDADSYMKALQAHGLVGNVYLDSNRHLWIQTSTGVNSPVPCGVYGSRLATTSVVQQAMHVPYAKKLGMSEDDFRLAQSIFLSLRGPTLKGQESQVVSAPLSVFVKQMQAQWDLGPISHDSMTKYIVAMDADFNPCVSATSTSGIPNWKNRYYTCRNSGSNNVMEYDPTVAAGYSKMRNQVALGLANLHTTTFGTVNPNAPHAVLWDTLTSTQPWGSINSSDPRHDLALYLANQNPKYGFTKTFSKKLTALPALPTAGVVATSLSLLSPTFPPALQAQQNLVNLFRQYPMSGSYIRANNFNSSPIRMATLPTNTALPRVSVPANAPANAAIPSMASQNIQNLLQGKISGETQAAQAFNSLASTNDPIAQAGFEMANNNIADLTALKTKIQNGTYTPSGAAGGMARYVDKAGDAAYISPAGDTQIWQKTSGNGNDGVSNYTLQGYGATDSSGKVQEGLGEIVAVGPKGTSYAMTGTVGGQTFSLPATLDGKGNLTCKGITGQALKNGIKNLSDYNTKADSVSSDLQGLLKSSSASAADKKNAQEQLSALNRNRSILNGNFSCFANTKVVSKKASFLKSLKRLSLDDEEEGDAAADNCTAASDDESDIDGSEAENEPLEPDEEAPPAEEAAIGDTADDTTDADSEYKVMASYDPSQIQDPNLDPFTGSPYMQYGSDDGEGGTDGGYSDAGGDGEYADGSGDGGYADGGYDGGCVDDGYGNCEVELRAKHKPLPKAKVKTTKVKR